MRPSSACAVPRRCIARAPDAADLDPRLRRAVPPRRRSASRRTLRKRWQRSRAKASGCRASSKTCCFSLGSTKPVRSSASPSTLGRSDRRRRRCRSGRRPHAQLRLRAGGSGLVVDGDDRRLGRSSTTCSRTCGSTARGTAAYVTAPRRGDEFILLVEDNGPAFRTSCAAGSSIGSYALTRAAAGTPAARGSAGDRALDHHRARRLGRCPSRVPHGLAFELRLPARLSANSQPAHSLG